MNETKDLHVKQNKLDSERQVSCFAYYRESQKDSMKVGGRLSLNKRKERGHGRKGNRDGKSY